MNIIKYKFMSENIFIELPEDKVELINENAENEITGYRYQRTEQCK